MKSLSFFSSLYFFLLFIIVSCGEHKPENNSMVNNKDGGEVTADDQTGVKNDGGETNPLDLDEQLDDYIGNGDAFPADDNSGDIDSKSAEDYPAGEETAARLDEQIIKLSLSGGMPSFDPALTQSFFDFPFPHDQRRKSSGYIDISDYPNPKRIKILSDYISLADQELKGFGTNSPIYLRFDQPLSNSTLHMKPKDTMDFSSPIYLLNVEPGDPHQGEFIPLQMQFQVYSDDYIPSYTLSVQPVWGFPLKPSTRYALVVKREFNNVHNARLGSPGLFQAAFQGRYTSHPQVAILEKLYQPLTDFLKQKNQFYPDEIAIATIFTTQPISPELAQVRKYINDDFKQGKVNSIKYSGQTPYYYIFEGTYMGPNFQKGSPPYKNQGGFHFNSQGQPILQQLDNIRFAISIPKGTMPTSGWPITIYGHSSGGDYLEFQNKNNILQPATKLAIKKFAVISIDSPLYGTRVPQGTDGELFSINLHNLVAFRTNFRQSAADFITLAKLIKIGKFKIDSSISPNGLEIKLDRGRIYFLGLSHGGIGGVLALAVENRIRGAVFTGVGGGLSITLLKQNQKVNYLQVIRSLAQIPPNYTLTSFHPVMGLIQMLTEVVDPINYAPYFYRYSLDNIGRNVLLMEGMSDSVTPAKAIEALTIAGGLPLVEPKVADIPMLLLRGLSPLKPPVSENLQIAAGNKSTGGLLQFSGEDHQLLFKSANASSKYTDFLSTLSYAGIGMIK